MAQSTDMERTTLRVPDDLKREVKAAAAREGRTMNAQIVQHLREIYGIEDQQA